MAAPCNGVLGDVFVLSLFAAFVKYMSNPVKSTNQS